VQSRLSDTPSCVARSVFVEAVHDESDRTHS
jgi:hypothetical protein